MKLLNFLRTFMFIVLLGTIVSVVSSCNDDDSTGSKDIGKITGTVIDDEGSPVAGAAITVSGMDGTTVMTGSDGKYTIDNVTIESHALTFKKAGLQTVSSTVMANNFDTNKLASRDLIMRIAKAKIMGTVTDGKNGAAPLAGVIVSIGGSEFVTTGSDGKFILENLVADDYVLTFNKTDYPAITKEVKSADFVSDIATYNVELGGDEIFRGLTLTDLKAGDKWYYSEYRGGRNADAYPHWDWSTDYMSTLDFRGAWEEQNEGTTLQIRNNKDKLEQNNPANLDAFDSFVFGNKQITADNKILTLRVRTHNADDVNPAYFGVQVVDLSLPKPKAVKIGENKTYGSGNYGDVTFDLSEYVGKEITVAIGIYRAKTGDYWKQLVLRRIAFAQTKTSDWNWIPGAEVIPGWHLTKEMVRSTMPNAKTSFVGISPKKGDRGNYFDAYRSWRDISYIAKEWSFVPVNKDPEIFASEGYVMKTRGNTGVNTETPEVYFYSKFAIAQGSNELTLKTRNFGSNYTYFKLTAIKDDGTVVHIAPKSNTAQEASAAAEGCWKFKHGNGGPGTPNAYASFVYDLSQFNGTNVVIALGVYKGGTDTDENKLCIYSVDLK